MKKRFFLLAFLLCSVGNLLAQQTQVKGKVIDATTNENLPDVEVSIENSAFSVKTAADGSFNFNAFNLPLGEQVIALQKAGFVQKRFPVTINEGEVLDLETLPLEVDINEENYQIGTISLSDNELDNEESSADNLSGLLQASKDVFLNAAAYDFSATFFNPRGYDSENGKVLINGIEMNKMYNGRPQWSNWGGLNDAQRNQVFSMGLSANDYNFGDLAGTTNIIMRATQYQQGGRVSYASSNRSYRGRVMASYNTGMMEGGWAFSFLASRRFGEEGYRDGSLYDANSFFASVEKKLGENHSLNLTAFYTPNRRGKTSANTQEVYDLKDTQYNSYWGYQDGEIRNSRVRTIEEPVIMLNHYWDINDKTQLNTNVGYQFGEIGNSRLGYDNAPNPDPSYYQSLPSYHLANPEGPNYASAFLAEREFRQDGQIDWYNLYETNVLYGGTSRYYLYEDRNDDKQLMVNTILTSDINDNIRVNGTLSYRNLNSHNFANMLDLLGGNGYLDVDTYNQGDDAQSDLNNPNRVVGEGDTMKYNYELDASEYNAFAQGQFRYNKVDFYVGANVGKTTYQRNGLYKNGSYPDNSLGKSEELNFTTYGAKVGATYKITGRHMIDVNAAYMTDAPTLRSSFSNSRQNNMTVDGLTEEISQNIDASYIYRSPTIKGRLTGYYTKMQDATEISFFYADGISGAGRNQTTAFVQEVLSGIDKRHVGAELGIEAQITPTIKLKGAAAYGQYTYDNNPDLYLTSDDFELEEVGPDGQNDLGKSYLKDYKIAGGPQQAYQIGFEYRDPDYWWFGATSNFFSNAYVDVSPITRSQNFYLDTDGIPFGDYNEETARELLKQEEFDDYMLVNVVGGKSWKVGDYFVGFFATINNIFDEKYKTGGYEQGRNANYQNLVEDNSQDTRVFGPKYWYGYGTTYYLNVYLRF
ncbi:carboxypeptidase-like regulatory domain-containing protein [Haloflavibacter putidus]|uniref:TonB-dependent receptor n=1 Tax=Haloflavibacter putidus TaxID=2576776 RepID=A0A507ZMK3_9FLAO|nr:carboxypeptidase-like regulatory domain-containing protein [Haloflavibacter putidus]TQD38489.1 TonB-dependent receptor [Haloflavibacter putidus]